LKYLLDTHVLSEIRKPKGNLQVKEKIAAIDDEDLFLSVISVGEISNGIARLDAGKKRKELEAWFSQFEQHFADRVLPVTHDIAQLWGELTARLEKKGRTLHAADGLMAATALHHGLQLMTRNADDFEMTGVLISNPWDE
jgi:toxin FitB